MKRRATFLALLVVLASTAVWAQSKPKVVDVRVVNEGWGGAGPADIRAVCRSAAREFQRFMPEHKIDAIELRRSKEGPICLYQRTKDGRRVIKLDTQDTYWAQFAFQFAHEFCHHFAECKGGKNPNLWFEESLCETASLFALRRMANTWRTDPPYSNWKGYAPKLGEYAQDRLDKASLPEGMNIAAYFRRHEQHLIKNGTDRAKNNVFAKALLPLFEKEPEQWLALAYLNRGDRDVPFRVHLKSWHDRAPAKHKAFINKIAALFELNTK